MTPIHPYDLRELRRARSLLADALYQVDLALDPKRPYRNTDRSWRCAYASRFTREAVRILNNGHQRICLRKDEA